MVFSDALPIQFWHISTQTFNEREVDGINHSCWCQPLECNDEIVLQFTDDITSPAPTYTLVIIDKDDNELHSIEFDYSEISDDTALCSLSFVPSDLSPELCNLNVRMEIRSNDVAIAKSDCISIKDTQHDTVLFEYSNNRNFYGLIYADVSPEVVFYLRVPGVFYHRRTNREGKSIERTSSTVVTSSKMKKQQLLQVKHSPDYFHEKVELVLMQHNVEADGKLWKLEESYEKQLNDNKQSLKKASVWLSEKNNLVRNVL
jgi:hypothetical protein